MSHPTINFADGGFPDPQVSEIQALTAAIDNLAGAVDNLANADAHTVAERTADERLAHWNELRDREEDTLGPEFPEEEPPPARGVDGYERIIPTPEILEDFWAGAQAPPKPKEYTLTGTAQVDPETIKALFDEEGPVLPEPTLEDLPDGAYVDLDPLRELPRKAAEKADIYLNIPLPVRRVVKGDWSRRDPGCLDPFAWCAWDETDDLEYSTPWEFDTEQVEALGLTYSDFTLPTVPRPEPEEDVVREPAHYKENGRECIEFIRDLNFLPANVVKYVWRFPHKGNPVQDLQKARQYAIMAKEAGVSAPDNEERSDHFTALYMRAPGGTVEEDRYDILATLFEGKRWDYIVGCIDNLIARVQDV